MKAGFGTGAAPAAGEPSRLPGFVAPEVPEVAKLFPQLEIQQLLGQGGMGAVYRARQPALDRLVALKILPPQTRGEAGFADRFTREARALARLNHPNVVPATGLSNPIARSIQRTLSWWLTALPGRFTKYSTSLVLAKLTTRGA